MKILNRGISRRNLLKTTGLASAGTLLGPGTGRAATRPRALALIGDRYHNPDYIRTSLDKVFHALDIPCLLYTSPSPRDS